MKHESETREIIYTNSSCIFLQRLSNAQILSFPAVFLLVFERRNWSIEPTMNEEETHNKHKRMYYQKVQT
jgi:hypothetical protein